MDSFPAKENMIRLSPKSRTYRAVCRALSLFFVSAISVMHLTLSKTQTDKKAAALNLQIHAESDRKPLMQAAQSL